MADTPHPVSMFDTPPVVDQIDSLLRRDLDVIDVSDERIVVDLADSANDGLVVVEPESEPDERPLPDVDLDDPLAVEALQQIATLFDDPQLQRLVSLLRRQADSPS